MVSIAVRVPDEILERLNNLAQLTGRSKTFYIKAAIMEKLSELEMLYLAKERAEDVHSGKSKRYTLDEVLKRNGLSD